MQRRNLIALIAVCSMSLSAQGALLSPQSFETQIRQGVKKLTGWESVDQNKDGTWRKVSLFQTNILKLDVVKSESLLRPYMGTLHMTFNLVFSDSFPTRESAAASLMHIQKDLGNTSTFECEYQFAPGDVRWEFVSGRTRSSASFAAGDYDWFPLNAATINNDGNIHKAVVEVLSSPSPKSSKPAASKRKQT